MPREPCAQLTIQVAPLLQVLLDPPRPLLEARLAARMQAGAHFMPPTLLDSQLATLEREGQEPGTGFTLTITVASAGSESRESTGIPSTESSSNSPDNVVLLAHHPTTTTIVQMILAHIMIAC